MLLEIAVFNITSAIIAQRAGADRIELCENPYDGGTTPSYGTLKKVRERISIPVFPIIRPRGGDFLYSDEEYAVMLEEIKLCRSLGYDGVVLGLLLPDGTIDEARTARLVEAAYPMEVTFHRAFDRCAQPLEALETIIACGCQRILTSGQVPNAWDGRELLKQLVHKAADRIIIMPGSGVRSSNCKALAEFTGAVELHSSARKQTPSAMQFEVAGMQEDLSMTIADEAEVHAILAALK
ncbi:copper homeostasis protein CutC [Deminuibacter soli]|uniref:PF03932 family protein CutC n=1 Tax=Deminuibacter soli TaxID=2291815 RepID=A0A3E1NJJ6_9BACT|nr:copper homeostasis protein CutC [Deminuibacter soli]RFM28099.1 copper homeostasis protein CutC [Deminuibacter soli]